MAARNLPVPERDGLLAVLSELDAYVESLPHAAPIRPGRLDPAPPRRHREPA